MGFFCNRLEDSDSIKEVADGLRALIVMKAFSSNNIDEILNGLKSSITMKEFNQSTRHKIFSILKSLLDTNLNHLKTTNDLFISAFIHLTTGEKDPRNLMLSFQIASNILTNFDVEKFTEDLFYVTFCYFPVTFTPPKNDPYGITSEDLKQALKACISANGVFANDAFPGLLEKLTSSSMKIKNDTLVTIAACVKNYDSDHTGPHWQELWDGLKFEVIHGSEEGTPELTLDVLRELGRSLGKASDQSLFESYVEAILKETKENATEIQSKKALPSVRLAAGIAASSKTMFDRIAAEILAYVLQVSAQSPTIAAQRIMLDMVGYFVKSSGGFAGDNVLLPYKDRIIDFYGKSLMGAAKTELTLRVSAIEHFSEIVNLSGFLSTDEVGLIVQYLDDILLDDNKEELKEKALDALIIVADKHVNLILTIAFPALLAHLPDSETADNAGDIERILYALAKISVNRSTFEALSVRLLNKVSSALRTGCSYQYPQYIFTALLSVVLRLAEKDDEDVSIYISRLLPEIFTKFVEKFQEPTSPLFDPRVLHPTCILISRIVRASDSTKQTQFVQKLLNLFWKSEPSKLVTSKIFKADSLNPLQATSSPHSIVALFTAALAPVKKEIDLEVNLIDLIFNSISVLDSTNDSFQRLNYLQLISLVANKWVSSKSTEIQDLSEKLYSNIQSTKVKESLGSLEIYAWISKAYLLRTDAYAYVMVQKLVDLLADPRLGAPASKVMDILGDDDIILSKENGTVVRLLAKQRFFSFILTPLVTNFRAAASTPDIQANYLVAMSGVLRHMPPKVITADVPVFFPLLLQSLVIDDPKVREASISTITATLAESSSVVAQHISTLVPQLLNACNEKSSSFSRVRLAALTCLGEFPSAIERKNLEPFRQAIIKGLNIPLDDKKREVRRAAVNARQKYFELTIVSDE